MGMCSIKDNKFAYGNLRLVEEQWTDVGADRPASVHPPPKERPCGGVTYEQDKQSAVATRRANFG